MSDLQFPFPSCLLVPMKESRKATKRLAKILAKDPAAFSAAVANLPMEDLLESDFNICIDAPGNLSVLHDEPTLVIGDLTSYLSEFSTDLVDRENWYQRLKVISLSGARHPWFALYLLCRDIRIPVGTSYDSEQPVFRLALLQRLLAHWDLFMAIEHRFISSYAMRPTAQQWTNAACWMGRAFIDPDDVRLHKDRVADLDSEEIGMLLNDIVFEYANRE